MVVLLLSVGCVSTVDVDVDADKDGLLTSQEEAVGTDPTKSDSDGDGFDDGDEVSQYTDPGNPGDAPYTGGYRIDSCRNDIEGTGYTAGDVVKNFELSDQFEETVRSRDFCDQVILLDFSAGWCGACQSEAPTLQAFYAENKDKGFLAITVYMENTDYSEPTQDESETWADTYGLEFPVLLDDGVVYNGFAAATGSSSIGLPLMILIDRGLVVSINEGATEDDALALLGE